MYKPLPHGSCKLNPRHYRNRRLALVKKRAIKVKQTLAARRAIPQYFQKRIKHKLVARKSTLPANCSTESTSSDCDRSAAANGAEVLDDSNTAAREVECCDSGVQTKESNSITSETNIDAVEDSVDGKVLTVASSKAPAIDRADALKTIKEYYSIQCAIRLLLSMLQERMEEVQTMQKVVIGPALKEEAVDKAAPLTSSDVAVEADHGTTETDEPDVKDVKDVSVKNESNRTSDRIVKDCDPDKENNVPLASTVESMSPVAVALNRVHSTPTKEEPKDDTKPYSFLETSKSDILDPSFTCDIELEPLEKRKHRSIVDSLLNKFNLSPPVKATVPSTFTDHGMDALDGRRSLRDRTKIAARPRYSEIPEEPRKMRVSKVFGKLHKTLNIDLDCTNSNSSTEFYGFDEGEVVKLDKPSLPGLLPTPIVKKSQPFAPFLTYGSSIETEQTQSESEPRSDLFREEGLISFGSVPPRLECPQRPNDMVRPRTVAQKRILVQRENDIRYVMIDNESKIFHFLKKRSQNIDAALDFCRMKELQDQQIPFTHSTWRALAWLRSEKGHYYIQTINIDNRTIKLNGCRGNHKFKSFSRATLYSSPVIASRGHRYHYVNNCHCPPHPEGVVLNIAQVSATGKKKEDAHSEQRLVPYDNSKYLYRGSSNNTGYQSKRSYPGTKPGPLSSKCLQPSPDEDPCLGPLEVFKMPKVELEVFPKINRPLDGYVKPYLKMILPHNDITENWARFAVSTLTAPKEETTTEDKTLADENEERSFVFELPYTNNQRRMLIRRRLLACPGAPINIDVARFTTLMDEKLTFRKAIDEALERGEGERIDPDELVCADVLSAVTDSVAISLAEDVFVQDDPDIEYARKRDDVRSYQEQMSVPKSTEVSEHHGADEKVSSSSSDPSPSVVVPNDVGTDADGVAALNSSGGSECSKTHDPAKAKLLREMKRLNATIIEGPSESTQGPHEPGRQQHRCDPEYCAKGCLCDVLSGSVANIHWKLHCGQIDCMFGCTCGFAQSSNMAHQTKVEHGEDEDGETALSREEQRFLREKATARLAKEEREFTPTVILTKNTTVLVQNKESECRRLKKKPKKYDDYYNDQSVQCLLNGGSVKDVSSYISKPPPNAKPLSEVERMRHAHVLLTRLPQLTDIEPLCMVHGLYRCFCGGKATQGKPFSFTEENCIDIASKASGSEGSSFSTSLEVMPSGRMTKGGSQTSAKARSKDQEVVEPRLDTANMSPLVNGRKRLYSFEKLQSDHNEGKVLKTFQPPPVQRRRRDSSEESYKPPNERKVAKKSSKTTANDTVAFGGGAIRARRASVAPGHMYARPDATIRRPSVATQPATVANKQLSLAMRRASVASPHLFQQKSGKPTSASSRRNDTPERSIADNSLYTIIKPKKDSGSSKINNLILKRVTPQATVSDARTAPNNKTTSATKGQEVNKSNNVPIMPDRTKRMTVRELKQLMMRECKSASEGACSSAAADNVVNLLLVDSEENIDNEPGLNILTEGTKKLVISGKRRSYVERSEFKNGQPPARTVQCSIRPVYVVEIPTENAEVKSKAFQSPFVKKTINKALRQNAEPEVVKLSDNSPRQHLQQPSTSGAEGKRSVPAQSQEGGGTVVEKTDRLLCSLQQHINELLRRDSLDISLGKKGILHICRWKQLLGAFALGEIDVLDLTLTDGTAMTVILKNPSEQQLLMPNVKFQLSAHRLTIDKLHEAEHPSLLMKMVVCQVDNVKMNNLALVLYGTQKYWRFCGFLQANEKCARNDGNVLTNPSKQATAKIKARLKEYYQKTAPSSYTVTSQGQQSSKPTAPSTVSLSTQSNIEILRKGLQQVHFPLGLLPGLPNGESPRWMRLKIENDFSHMYLQSWQCCITYGTIKKAIYDANRMGKPICLETPIPRDQILTQLLPYVYALPKEGHALFLGPYKTTDTTVDVILCQSVNGSLYEREVYERLNGITTGTTTKRTSGWWVDTVTSRVASADILAKQQKTTVEAKKKGVQVACQRSLLKRNNIPSSLVTANASTNDKMADEVRTIQHDSDDVVVLESHSNEGFTISSNNGVVVQESSVPNGSNAVDLLKLVQGAMRQNQQKKREIALSWEMQRASSKTPQTLPGVGRTDQNRKRSSVETTGGSSAVEFAVPAKVLRRSDPFIASPAIQNLQQQQHPSSGGTSRIVPHSTVQSNGFRRLSLSGSQVIKAATNMIRPSGTISITPMKPPEKIVPTKAPQSSQTLNNIQGPLERIRSSNFRRLSVADPQSLNRALTATRNNGAAGIASPKPPETTVLTQTAHGAARLLNSQGPSSHQSVSGTNKSFPAQTAESTTRTPIPRSRLNSIAVERLNRTPPTMLQVDEGQDDVVLLDDDDDDNGGEVNHVAVKTSLPTGNVQRLMPRTSNGNGAQTYGQKTLLTKEQLQLISRKLDLKKTGQQDGYNYNSAAGVLKISRSLLNALQRDGILNESVGNGMSPNGKNVTVASNSKSGPSPASATATSSTTITMPRMKVVPRIPVTPATAMYRSGSVNRLSDGGTDTAGSTAQSRQSSTNAAINLKYLNEEQKHLKMLTDPHTKGVLESKIPRLGLVEAVRFHNQEVILNLKELTVKKQLVIVPNLEAAVRLLNQFIHCNTYAFRPANLVIQWQFKEQIAMVNPKEKLTSIISQCCIITPYGLVNLFKQFQIDAVRQIAPPEVYEDMLKMKLAVLSMDKKIYESEQCNEHEDKLCDRAVNMIKMLEKKRQSLLRQVGNFGKLVKANEAKLRDLKQAPSSAEGNNASASGSQESVIVIDDD